MHYGEYAFSKNDLPTIATKNGEDIGQRNGLSHYDIIGLNKLHPCSKIIIIDILKLWYYFL